jgi:hypothetical protein
MEASEAMVLQRADEEREENGIGMRLSYKVKRAGLKLSNSV